MRASDERMTKEEFRSELDRLRLTQQEAAEAMGVNDRTIRRWALGERPIPPVAIKLISTLTPKPAPPEPEPVAEPVNEPVNDFAAHRLAVAQAAADEADKAASKAARKAAKGKGGRGVAPAPAKPATRPRKAIAKAARAGGKAAIPRRGQRHA